MYDCFKSFFNFVIENQIKVTFIVNRFRFNLIIHK